MQIFAVTDRTLVVDVDASSTVADVKAAVHAQQGMASNAQRIIYAGKQLEDSTVLSGCGVEEASTLHVLMRLAGGAKKRKKKTYTKPKKQKHKHKKIKLRVLKYYKVDDSGKVQRLRKQCPEECCGNGIFMATHFDRVYCGKCFAMYTMNENEGSGGKVGKKSKA